VGERLHALVALKDAREPVRKQRLELFVPGKGAHVAAEHVHVILVALEEVPRRGEGS